MKKYSFTSETNIVVEYVQYFNLIVKLYDLGDPIELEGHDNE